MPTVTLPRVARLASSLLAAATIAACSTQSTPSATAAAPRGITVIKPQPLGSDALAWPVLTETNKPWTRWWWMGSAVDKADITRQLELFHNANEGGVEICPIYGVQGNEANEIPFLSPKWVDMLAHTTTEGKRIGIGVDMTTGTGWPFGGPFVSAADASSSVQMRRYDVVPGGQVTGELPKGKVQFVGVQGSDGKMSDITNTLVEGKITWTAPASGSFKVYVLAQTDAIQKVKRSAPGGEGNVLDPYSPQAMKDYLGVFDKAFAAAGFTAPRPRSEFHDSFEYYGANWTDDFLAQFQNRRGYDLRPYIPALMGEGDPDTSARVKCDYRETIADLHLAYMKAWVDWAHAHGELTRNQAHGSPANILDAYAVSDIPECEIFHLYDESNIPFLKLANSAAHVTGKRLASSESFTWLGDHFNVSLADVKAPTDFLFVTGVNHIFFHGTPYSPASAPWPGYNFYASVNFGPNGGMFHDIGAMNAYIARCQSILQANKPGNDVLLYMPFYEVWQHKLTATEIGSGQPLESIKQDLMYQFTTPGDWMKPFPFYTTATDLFKKGYSYDEVSDALLTDARASSEGISLGGNLYKTILIPETPVLPVATLQKLADLAKGGARIIFLGKVPTDVPGLHNLDARRSQLAALGTSLEGHMVAGDESHLDALLTQAGVRREAMIDQGIRFTRRFRPDGVDYFVVNKGEQAIDGWVPLATPATGAVILDPMMSDEVGTAALRQNQGHAEVYLQLQVGESRILRTTTDRAPDGEKWSYVEAAGPALPVTTNWSVHFTEKTDASEQLPPDFSTAELGDFATRGVPYNNFAGTAVYSATITAPATVSSDYYLDLGKVGDSARVSVNGHDLGTLWAAPFRVRVGKALHPGINNLKIEVTNIAANRIADFDRRGVVWKIFKDINVQNIKPGTRGDYVPMNGATYPERPAGLLGPVMLQPLSRKTPA